MQAVEGAGQLETRREGQRRQKIAAQPVVVPQLRIFISYDTETGRAFAESAQARLEHEGVAAWVWHRDHQPGGYTMTEIAEHIAEADFVLFICTEGSRASKGQEFEINTAIGGYDKPRPWIITPDRQYVPPALKGYNQEVCLIDDVGDACLRWLERQALDFPTWPTVDLRAAISTTETAEVPQ